MIYTSHIKSSYSSGGLRRQTVQDFLSAVAFVEQFKKFDQIYVYEQEGNE
jgi:hypothetical protein|tara:strand:- start:531 stop:680 length:150 start_codon:yes stop_codon:yes gene_type:complete